MASDKDKKEIEDAFGVLSEYNPKCVALDSAQSNIDTFEDTGCYIFNALLSGNFRGGFPEGRISVLAAPSSVGKSYIALRTAAIAQEVKGKYVVIFDSENAIDKEFAKNMGVDQSKCRYFPVKSIEDCKNALYAFLDHVYKTESLHGKFFIIIDSLAAMLSEMDYTRLDKKSDSADMGTFAKAMKGLIKVCTTMSGLTKTTIVATNHIYDNPGQLHPTVEKEMPGGKTVRYLPSTICQLSATKVKEGDDKRKIDEESAKGSKDCIGIAVTGLSVKNRVCKPYNVANMYISWKNGLSKYYGLLDLAKEFGLLNNKAGWYYPTEDYPELGLSKDKRIGTKAQLNESGDFWESFMPVMQKALDSEWKYASEAERAENRRLEKELEKELERE